MTRTTKFLLCALAGLAMTLAWTVAQVQSRADQYRLIGYNCGPDGDTYLAAEEDQFPACERIEPIEL